MLTKTQATQTLTRQELREAVYKSLRALSRSEARQIVDDAFEEIFEALGRGEPVKLHAFGIFALRSKRERIGRNPKTGEEAIIRARRVVTFRPSPTLVARINGYAGAGLRTD